MGKLAIKITRKWDQTRLSYYAHNERTDKSNETMCIISAIE